MWSLQNSPPTSSRLSFYLTLVWGFGNLYVAMVFLMCEITDCGLAAKPPQFASLSCFKLFFFPSSLLFVMSNTILANAESTTSFPCKQKKQNLPKWERQVFLQSDRTSALSTAHLLEETEMSGSLCYSSWPDIQLLKLAFQAVIYFPFPGITLTCLLRFWKRRALGVETLHLDTLHC